MSVFLNCIFFSDLYYFSNDLQIFIQTGYPLDLPSGSLGSYCIYEYHMVHIISHTLYPKLYTIYLIDLIELMSCHWMAF